MEDNLHAGAGPGAGSGIGQIALDELHGFKTDQVGALAGDEVVDAAHGLAAREQGRGDGAADKAGCPGNKIACQMKTPQ